MDEPVVLITGASSGIGRASALAFARAGYHVIGMARRLERLETLQAEIRRLPSPHGGFLPIEGDVRQANSVEAAVSRTLEKFGRLDVLVANAGVGHRGTIADSGWDDMQTLLRTNIDGVLHSVRASVPAMRQAGGGHIVLVSSVAATVYLPYAAIYAASKAFISNLGGSLRLELESDNIMVTDMLVGRTATEFDPNRLGAGKRNSSSLPAMNVEQVAAAILKAIERKPRRVVLRWLDRLIILGGAAAPDLIGRLAKKQYED